MLGILWKDLKVMRMQTAILTSIFLMMTVASVWNTGRQDDICLLYTSDAADE